MEKFYQLFKEHPLSNFFITKIIEIPSDSEDEN